MLFDLTLKITPELLVFPGDPHFKRKSLMNVNNGDDFSLELFHLNNHMGTHIDYPSHVIKDGKSSDDFNIENLCGEGIIIEITHDSDIKASDIDETKINSGDIVFFKTRNTRDQLLYRPFSEEYTCVMPDAAKKLLNLKVKMVGVDYINIDHDSDDGLSAHHILLSHDVLIAEALELSKIPSGRYDFTIAPIHVNNSDGLPARIIAKPM
tara:strand:+ start:54 stop:680 length:627 start_codon:yes stop_codon:yes gene_type:complete